MSRYTPRNSPDFEKRQQCFPFGEACRYVAALALQVKRDLRAW